MTDLFITREI